MTDTATSPAILTPQQLAGFSWETLPPTFILETASGPLLFQHCLRFLPGRRIAGQAQWQGKTVFAKLFLTHPKRAKKERHTLDQLIAQRLPAPAVIDLLELKGGALLITQWLNAEPVKQLPLPMRLSKLTALVLKLSDAGFYQPDLHFDNFLWDGKQLWLVDAGEIQTVAPQQAKQQQLESFAILCTQLPLHQRMSARKLIETRLSKQASHPVLLSRIICAKHHKHVQRMMKKWQRECTAIKVVENDSASWHIDRELPAAVEQELLDATEHLDTLERLKLGSKVAVYRHPAGWILKHYHQGNWKNRAKAKTFRGRADISWVMGWTLAKLGIPTPKPVLLWRHKDGQQLIIFPLVKGDILAKSIEAGAGPDSVGARRACYWLNLMHLYGFWHGDTKAYNALLDADNEVHWIDLDAAGYSNTRMRLARRILADNERFQRNWSDLSEIDTLT